MIFQNLMPRLQKYLSKDSFNLIGFKLCPKSPLLKWIRWLKVEVGRGKKLPKLWYCQPAFLLFITSWNYFCPVTCTLQRGINERVAFFALAYDSVKNQDIYLCISWTHVKTRMPLQKWINFIVQFERLPSLFTKARNMLGYAWLDYTYLNRK